MDELFGNSTNTDLDKVNIKLKNQWMKNKTTFTNFNSW